MQVLRALLTQLLYGEPGCTECGRRRFAPGALVADACEEHYRARVRSLL